MFQRQSNFFKVLFHTIDVFTDRKIMNDLKLHDCMEPIPGKDFLFSFKFLHPPVIQQ